MKLVRLKIGNEFRSLPAGFEILFAANEGEASNEPICLVGVNGSGKSNVLEALAEIFAYLNTPHLNFVKHYTDSPEINSFELEYLLPKYYVAGSIWTDLIPQITGDWVHIKVTKEVDISPNYSIIIGNISRDLEPRVGLLPQRIIGYSSGQNEILSIPFNRILFKYFHNLSQEQSKLRNEVYEDEDEVSEKFISFGDVEYGRLQFLNYLDSPIIILSTLLAHTAETSFSSEIAGIKLIFFEFKIRKNLSSDDGIYPTSDTKKFLEFLTAVASTTDEDDRFMFIMISVDAKTQKAFQNRFLDASSIFNAFYNLSLLNINGIPKKRMNRFLKDGSFDYMNYRLTELEPIKTFFRVTNLEITMDGLEDSISYKELSDGEHQLLHILGLVNCFREDVCLFLLDEPETHFNPKWKYEYFDLLKQSGSTNRSQVLMTTHDPVLLSGLRKENVVVFKKRNERPPRWFIPSKDLFGMGVDAILISEIFGFDSTLDSNTKRELIELKELYIKREKGSVSLDEEKKYSILYNKLRSIDYAKPQNDPIYRQFLLLLDELNLYKKTFLTEEELQIRDKNAEEAIKKISDLYSE